MNKPIFVKIMKSNASQYKLFVICNTVLTSVCYFFSGICFNEQFTSDRYVDSMISSNILAPTCIVFIFAVFFIPYTHFSFNIMNEKQYGIMEATGVSWRDLRAHVLKENVVLAGCSLTLGLFNGIILQTLFFKIFLKVIGINLDLHIVSKRSVLIASCVLLSIYTLTIAFVVGRLSLITVKDMINDSKKVRIGSASNRILLMVGISAIVYANIGVFIFFDYTNTNKLFIYYAVMLTGIYLIISNSYVLLDCAKRCKKSTFYRMLPVVGSIRRNYSANKRIIFLSICLISFVVFFHSFSIYCSKLMLRNAINDYPQQIAYIEYDVGGYPSEQDIQQYAQEANVLISRDLKIPALIDGSIIISQTSANDYLGVSSDVDRNECIVYTQYNPHDGYPHEEFNRKNYYVGGMEFDVRQTKYSTLVNNAITIKHVVIVNDSIFDYLLRKNDSPERAAIRMIECSTLKQSEDLYNTMSKYYNLSVDGLFIAAKFIGLKTARQSGCFLILVSSIMNFLLLFLNAVMIYYKVQSNKEYNIKVNKMLWELGFSDDEIIRFKKKEAGIIFIVPAIIAIIIGMTMVVGLARI